MTECLLDQTPQSFDASVKTWGELLRMLDDWLGATRRVVTAVRFEGVEQPSFRAEDTVSRALSDLARVEVETAAASEVLDGAIQTARDSIGVLAGSATLMAATFRGRDVRHAHARFGELAEAVRHLTLLTAAVGEAAGVDFGTLSCGPLPAAHIIGGVGASLESLLAALEAHDWIGAADNLEFELAPAIEQWTIVFDRIHEEEMKRETR